ncbi:hypothetical protein ACP4OV_031190 [Aristida adscensionis]
MKGRGSMGIRRFVYLVTDDIMSRYSLRRIDVSRFFFPKSKGHPLPVPPPLEERRLPPTVMTFSPPFSPSSYGSLHFMLLPGIHAGRSDKVIATDRTGRALLFDTGSLSVRTLCSLAAPKFLPVSVTVGDHDLYILDTILTRDGHCFEGLFFDNGSQGNIAHEDWYCHPLPLPPYLQAYRPGFEEDIAHITSYALVGGSNIWVSKDTLGTHSYDARSGVWTKVGNWALPFYGHAQYVQEHNLWFGLSSSGAHGENCFMCASDLTVADPPIARNIWIDKVQPPEWISVSSHLVHLGRSRFCHARFFETGPPYEDRRKFVVFTGIEVEAAGGRVSVVEHGSEVYKVVSKFMQWVL